MLIKPKGFNILLSVTNTKIGRKSVRAKSMWNDLIEIYRILYLTMAEYTFFFKYRRTFHEERPYSGHKLNLNKLKTLENHTRKTVSDRKRIKLGITERYL